MNKYTQGYIHIYLSYLSQIIVTKYLLVNSSSVIVMVGRVGMISSGSLVLSMSTSLETGKKNTGSEQHLITGISARINYFNVVKKEMFQIKNNNTILIIY